jgi:hypothetical protein
MFTGSNSEEVAGISRGSDPIWLSLGFRARETLRVSTRRRVGNRQRAHRTISHRDTRGKDRLVNTGRLPGTYFRAQRFGLDPDHPGCLIPLKCHRLTIG